MSGIPHISIGKLDLWGKFREDTVQMNLARITDEQGNVRWILVEQEKQAPTLEQLNSNVVDQTLLK